jgi:hypothetical protein
MRDGADRWWAGKHALAGWFCLAVVVVACVALAVSTLAGSQPVAWATTVRTFGALGLLALLTPAAVVVCWEGGRRRSSLVAPIAFAIAAYTVLEAERLHWRWSRAEFEHVADSDRPPCRGLRTGPAPIDSPSCEVGRWRISGMSRYDDAVVIWFEGCVYGAGLARPSRPDVGADAVQQAVRQSGVTAADITVERWHDGWYTVCLTM